MLHLIKSRAWARDFCHFPGVTPRIARTPLYPGQPSMLRASVPQLLLSLHTHRPPSRQLREQSNGYCHDFVTRSKQITGTILRSRLEVAQRPFVGTQSPSLKAVRVNITSRSYSVMIELSNSSSAARTLSLALLKSSKTLTTNLPCSSAGGSALGSSRKTHRGDAGRSGNSGRWGGGCGGRSRRGARGWGRLTLRQMNPGGCTHR